MPWIISFIVSWILFLLLVDKATLKTNIWGGVLALALASIVDWGGQRLELYTFKNVIIPWFTCSAFYKFGPVFTMGVLFSQFVPQKKLWQVLNILVITVMYLALEYIITLTGVAEYIHWHLLASCVINILALTTLTWFSLTFLKKT